MHHLCMHHLITPTGQRLCKRTPPPLLDLLPGDCELCNLAWAKQAVAGWKEAAEWGGGEEAVLELLGVDDWETAMKIIAGVE